MSNKALSPNSPIYRLLQLGRVLTFTTADWPNALCVARADPAYLRALYRAVRAGWFVKGPDGSWLITSEGSLQYSRYTDKLQAQTSERTRRAILSQTSARK